MCHFDKVVNPLVPLFEGGEPLSPPFPLVLYLNVLMLLLLVLGSFVRRAEADMNN